MRNLDSLDANFLPLNTAAAAPKQPQNQEHQDQDQADEELLASLLADDEIPRLDIATVRLHSASLAAWQVLIPLLLEPSTLSAVEIDLAGGLALRKLGAFLRRATGDAEQVECDPCETVHALPLRGVDCVIISNFQLSDRFEHTVDQVERVARQYLTNRAGDPIQWIVESKRPNEIRFRVDTQNACMDRATARRKQQQHGRQQQQQRQQQQEQQQLRDVVLSAHSSPRSGGKE